MWPMPLWPAPAHWWQMEVSGLLLHWQLWLGAYFVGFFFSPCYVALWDSKTHHRPACARISYCVETSSPSRPPPQDGSLSLTLCLSFCLLYFVLPPFEENGLPFWVPAILHQCSEVVLWKLLSVQMLFWWICGGESGLPVLFFHHLGTTPSHIL